MERLYIYRTITTRERDSLGIVDSVSLATILEYDLMFLRAHGVINVTDAWIANVLSKMKAAAGVYNVLEIDGVMYSEDEDAAHWVIGGWEDSSFLAYLPSQKIIPTAVLRSFMGRDERLRVQALDDGGFRILGVNWGLDSFTLRDAQGVAVPYVLEGERLQTQGRGAAYLRIQSGAHKGATLNLNRL